MVVHNPRGLKYIDLISKFHVVSKALKFKRGYLSKNTSNTDKTILLIISRKLREKPMSYIHFQIYT